MGTHPETDPEVDAYVARSDAWPAEIAALRPILLGCGLDETIKWHKPCYVHDGANIAIVQEMKDFLALMFFKGALLDDPDGVLESQGPNSRSARRVVMRSVDDVERLTGAIGALIASAVEVEAAGLAIEPTPELIVCDELRDALDADPALASAFESLTPGRRREYDLHISGAKQSSTRRSRVAKVVPRILAGKGLRDR